MVPDHCKIYLDYPVSCVFARERYLQRFIANLYEKKMTRIGHLIALSENEMFHMIKTSPDNQKRVKARLRQLGLSFGMRTATHELSPQPKP
jgi:histidinol phosphatase-like PHP family hydrolase